MEVMHKYDTKNVFNDPVVRCCDCRRIITREEIREVGMCPKCGNRRVRSVTVLDSDEKRQLERDGIDPEFLAIFEPVGKGAAK